MAIKAITIDFWNTLYHSDTDDLRTQARRRVVASHVKRLGADVEMAKILAAYDAAWQYFNGIWKNEHRTLSTEETITYFWKFLGVPADKSAIEDVSREFAEGILVHPPKLMPEADKFIGLLAEKYHIALISDTAFSPGIILRKLMAQDKVEHYFNVFSFSDETGVSKPNPKAFAHAINGKDFAPDECIHIGDIERTDIVGAKNFGMKAILFTGDYNPMVNETAPNHTRADFSAESWAEIFDIVRTLDS